jgi:hypothetical protein
LLFAAGIVLASSGLAPRPACAQDTFCITGYWSHAKGGAGASQQIYECGMSGTTCTARINQFAQMKTKGLVNGQVSCVPQGTSGPGAPGGGSGFAELAEEMRRLDAQRKADQDKQVRQAQGNAVASIHGNSAADDRLGASSRKQLQSLQDLDDDSSGGQYMSGAWINKMGSWLSNESLKTKGWVHDAKQQAEREAQSMKDWVDNELQSLFGHPDDRPKGLAPATVDPTFDQQKNRQVQRGFGNINGESTQPPASSTATVEVPGGCRCLGKPEDEPTIECQKICAQRLFEQQRRMTRPDTSGAPTPLGEETK